MSEPIIVQLDKPRAIRWTNRADARLGMLDRPPELRDIFSKNPRKGLYVLSACIWAALVDRDITDWEVIADHLQTAEAQTAALDALCRSLVEAGVLVGQKKTDGPS